MKIGLDMNTKSVQEYTHIPEATGYSKTERTGFTRLDIAGMYTDDNAYGVHGRTTEDVMMEAGALDLATARDYMTVMSNTMSGEDYKKMQDGDFDPSDMDAEDAATILDHIKAVMAQSGQIIVGYNDDISSSALEEVTGSTVSANSLHTMMKNADIPVTDENEKAIREAIALMEGIESLTDGSVKYMIDNEMDPTVKNIYLAKYSSFGDGSNQPKGYYAQDTNGYYAKKADNVDWDSLKDQVEDGIEQMNLPEITKEEALESAKWLIEKGIPVTEDRIIAYRDIRAIEWPVSDYEVAKAGTFAIAEGKNAKEANLSPNYVNRYEKAYELKKKVLSETINREEGRLRLSLDANLKLLRRDYSIDTDSISKIVESLKEEERSLMKAFLGDGTVEELDVKAQLFTETEDVLNDIPTLPAATIGKLNASEAISLRTVHTVGTQIRSSFDNAEEKYEQLMTSPRRDMGDSIKKAFRNVDDILSDLDIEPTEESRRAVRILGYNSMEINKEEINRVMKLDDKVQTAVRSLTPGKTLELIRQGINPLEMTLDEIVEKTGEIESNPKSEAEKYSKFLYKLQNSGQITETERESYIGIYRMLNRLEKTDYSSIGGIIETGMDLTFGNLLTAMRSNKYSLDVKIDDSFGVLQDTVKSGISITDQIMSAFASEVGNEENDRLEEKYAAEQMEDIRQASKASDEVIRELLDNGAKVSVNNTQAMEEFVADINGLYRNLRTFDRKNGRTDNTADSKDNRHTLGELSDSLIESMTDKESVSEAYEEMLDDMSDKLSDAIETVDNIIDIKSIMLMHKQLSLAGELSQEENYYIPVEVDDSVIGINLKVMHSDETGSVTIRMDNEKYGEVNVRAHVTGNKVETLILAENSDSGEVTSLGDRIRDELISNSFEEVEIRRISSNSHFSNKKMDENADNNNEAVSTERLYDVAKSIITSIKLT